MKDITFSRDGNKHIFDFYFNHNAQILFTIIGAVMVFSFTILYLCKPLSNMNDDGFFLLSFFIASSLSMHFYKKYSWLSSRKRVEISPDEILLYYANSVVTRLARDETIKVSQSKERILIFPFNTITIEGNDDKICIVGFKNGEDIDVTESKLKDIISQKNPE